MLGLVLTAVHPTATTSTATTSAATGADPSAPAGGAPAHPTTPLGDLGRFSAVVTSVQDKVRAGDLAGATTNVKDLEVAWDGAEAGLKPRDPKDWRLLDGEIDAVLTALRSPSPTQAASGAALDALDALAATLNTFDGV